MLKNESKKISLDNLDLIKNQVIWHDLPITIPRLHHLSIVNIISDFSDKLSEKNQSAKYYEQNRNAPPANVIRNLEIGKYGEFSSCLLLRKNGFPKIMPDVKIRTGSEKGWECDLPFGDKDGNYPNCGVKSCDQSTCDFLRSNRSPHEYTWVFQYANSNGRGGGRDRLFSEPDSNEVILFMFVPYLISGKASLIASAPWNKLQGIIKDPIASIHIGKKKCIYSEDLRLLSSCHKMVG